MNKDLTVGAPGSVLWRFSIPMFISVIFQQMYSMVDSMAAGRFVSEDALAAIGAAYPMTMLFIAVATGCNIGCSVVISRLFGGRRFTELKTAVSTSLLAGGVLSFLCTAAGILLAEPVLRLLQTPSNIFSASVLYLRIYVAGFAFSCLYNICNGIFTALGDSKTPLYFLIASSVGNIVLDLLFVVGFHWGVAGIAGATFLAQTAAGVLAMLWVRRRLQGIPAEETSAWYSSELFRQISLIAVPSILQQASISMGNILVQGLVNGFGSSVVAGYSAAAKLNTFFSTSILALGNGLSSFVSQNIGARKLERVKGGVRACLKMALGITLGFFVLFWGFAPWVIRLFLEDSSSVAVSTGVGFLRLAVPFYPLLATKLTSDGVLRGSGAMRYFMTATFADLSMRVVMCYLVVGFWGITGIEAAWPVGWLVGCTLSMGFYLSGKWRPKEQEG